MKITVVGPVFPYRGGIAHFTTLLVQNLKASGHTVQVISFRRQYPSWLYPGESDRDPSQQPLKVDAEFILDPLYPWTWWDAVRRVTHEHPDLVLIQWWTTFWAPAYAALSSAIHSQGVRNGYLIHQVLPHESHFGDHWLAHLAFHPADAFLLQNEKEIEALMKLVPVPGAVIKIAAMPIFDMFADQKMAVEQARQRLNLPANAKVLLFFGIVRHYKGLKILLEAVSLLRAQHIDTHLLVAGEFWEEKKEYQDEIERLGIQDYVHLTDRYIPNEEVPLYFSAADLLVAPYLEVSNSAAVKMALGFGLPAVITEPMVDDMLVGRPDVCAVPAEDAIQLKEGITAMLLKSQTAKLPPGDNGWGRVVEMIVEMAGTKKTTFS
jgi:glycosyltransferase involved in cell wall biosynthesis